MTEKYLLSRKGFGQRGLQSLCEEADVSLSNVEEFGRRALTIVLDTHQIERLRKLDPLVTVAHYESLKIR